MSRNSALLYKPAWRKLVGASFFAADVTIVGCMILYGLRMIGLQLDEPIDESES